MPTIKRKTKADLEIEIKDLKKTIKEQKDNVGKKQLEVESIKKQQIEEETNNITADSIISKLNIINSEISESITNISRQMSQEVKNLDTINQAVEFKKDELKKLHNIEVVNLSLEQMISDFEDKKNELSKENTELKKDWEEEKFQREIEQKEFEDNLKKNRKREKDEFDYKLSLERKKEIDDYKYHIKTQELENEERKSTLEKSWSEREELLKQREDEFSKYKKEVETFPKTLKIEIEKNVLENDNRWKEKYKTDLILATKDFEAKEKLLEMKISSLEETAGGQKTQIESISKELTASKQQVQDIALKAIEGASGYNALKHVNKIAMEQAKTNSNTQ